MTSTLFFLEKKLDSVLEQSSRILIHYHPMGGITRYKHLIVILMTITTIVYLANGQNTISHYLKHFFLVVLPY